MAGAALSGIIFVVPALVSCNSHDVRRKEIAEEYKKRLPAMEQSGIVAGPGEKTFEETYRVKVHLPIPEREFLALLDRLKLRYEILGDRATKVGISAPWHSSTLDLSQIEREYQIYGKVDRVRKVAEGYRAYVDKQGQVIYMENMFAYYDAP